ncbi:hypothetical protein POM88_042364 [Heracleum sosnowskyi]|uniref:Pentatricopeptide repeat-containing protein n=1 Tax=Heracleum sosnowskyi TaxID=360622 RepID=A0AAD8HHL9_9APIA|nr:hypothetical protein POM88_042364 [Heracleum sosnowskyi]
MEENNCPPDSVTYNELVAAYVRAGFSEEGAATIDKIPQKGVLPNAITYTTVIDAFGKAGKVDKALSLFKQMKKSGCVPNVSTYTPRERMLSLCKSPAEWTTDNLESNFTPEEHNLGDKHVVIIIIDENPYAILPNVKNDMHQESGLHYNYNQWQLRSAQLDNLFCMDKDREN